MSTWRAQAACRGMSIDIFFPEPGDTGAEAREICQECLVAKCCLEESLRIVNTHGIWAGTTQRARERIRNERDRARRQQRP